MTPKKSPAIYIGCAAAFAFILLNLPSPTPPSDTPYLNADRVALPSPALLVLSAGDPYLAANLESFRASSTWEGTDESISVDARFQLRTRKNIALLNPCNEDNYYHSNALLAWSGAPTDGNKVLKMATDCRFWDELPPFFYGFNQYYFFHKPEEAISAIDLAVQRTKKNKASWQRLSIMIKANQLDSKAAYALIKDELDKATDQKLKTMLAKRLQRLSNLIAMQDAQKAYEKKYKTPLTDPFDLIHKGYLDKFPSDPLGIGYEFSDGQFKMKTLELR